MAVESFTPMDNGSTQTVLSVIEDNEYDSHKLARIFVEAHPEGNTVKVLTHVDYLQEPEVIHKVLVQSTFSDADE